MLLANTTPLIIGTLIGLGLLAVGILLGVRLGRRSRSSQPDGGTLGDGERQRVMELLKDLEAWTNEYSGNVSEYQSELGQLSESVPRGAGASQSENRVVLLLGQIMQSNQQLQARLEAAEHQLEKQTHQIASYLTEARTDGLTGLFNRRAFDQRLDELFQAYRSGRRSFVLVLIDIDRFKSINDTYGHQVGDQVLQHLATTLRAKLDRAVIVARFGGEEFAAIIDGPLKIAAQQMNELRKQIAKERIDVGKTKLDLTVSIGLSEPREDIVIGPVLGRADEALYAAKNMGRDRTYYHDGRHPTLVGAPEVAS